MNLVSIMFVFINNMYFVDKICSDTILEAGLSIECDVNISAEIVQMFQFSFVSPGN